MRLENSHKKPPTCGTTGRSWQYANHTRIQVMEIWKVVIVAITTCIGTQSTTKTEKKCDKDFQLIHFNKKWQNYHLNWIKVAFTHQLVSLNKAHYLVGLVF